MKEEINVSRVLKVTLNEGLYECAKKEAIRHGNTIDTSKWIANTIRTDLRARLSKNGFTPEELDKKA